MDTSNLSKYFFNKLFISYSFLCPILVTFVNINGATDMAAINTGIAGTTANIAADPTNP